MNHGTKSFLFAALSAAAIVTAFLLPPFTRELTSHGFADGRTLFGIPNALDVLSNLPFLAVGAAGLALVLRRRTHFKEAWERWPHAIFFACVALVALGSGYYHWAPDSGTLFWDRLPMAIVFTALVGITVIERVSPRAGAWLFAPLVAAGAASVIHWRESGGDLRFYILAQYASIAVIAILILSFRPRYTRTADLLVAIGFYAMAKLCEMLDAPIYEALDLLSGHTLKHLLAGGVTAWLLRMVWKRRPIDESHFLVKCREIE